MTAAVCEPASKAGAESAEVRKAKRGAGSRAVGECGKREEKVRNLSLFSVPVCHPRPAAPAAAGILPPPTWHRLADGADACQAGPVLAVPFLVPAFCGANGSPGRAAHRPALMTGEYRSTLALVLRELGRRGGVTVTTEAAPG